MTFVEKWTHGLRGKLLLLGMIPTMLFITLSIYSIKQIDELSAKLDKSNKVRAKLIYHVGQMDSSVHAIGRWAWITYGFNGNIEKRSLFIKNLKDQMTSFEENKESYLKLPRNVKAVEIFQVVEDIWPKVAKAITDSINHFEKNTNEENELAKLILQKDLAPNLIPLTNTYKELITLMDEILAQETAETDKQISLAKSILLWSSIICGLLLVVLTLYLIQNLVMSLTNVSLSLKDSSHEVSFASTKIASSSEQFSQASSEQAASLQETSTSLEEINSMISNNTENAKQARLVSRKSLNSTEKGKEIVDHMITAIGEINASNIGISKQIDATNKEIENIVKIINDIGIKTGVINDIVFQTKLLSFNASVEAARAGDQGKGFAVVAEEVGNLAAMSGLAAQEITKMLENSIKTVQDIVLNSKSNIGKLVSQSSDKVKIGTEIAHQCEEAFTDILANISDVSKMVTEISNASEEQSRGISEINKAIAQLDQVTQQNSGTAHESANSAVSLSNQAVQLDSLVQLLVQTINGPGDSENKNAPNKNIGDKKSALPKNKPKRENKSITVIKKGDEKNAPTKKSAKISLVATTEKTQESDSDLANAPKNTDSRFIDI